MSVTRSPNYPSLPLDAALSAIEPALKAEHRNKMAKITLAKHLGYTSLNGRALGKIGAVRAYGLIEGSGDELRVSEDAMICLRAPVGSGERKDALERCATRPSLFKAIRTDFPDTLPSNDNLHFWLNKNGYTDRAAGKAAESYLLTMRLVGEGGHPSLVDVEPPRDEMVDDIDEQRSGGGLTSPGTPVTAQTNVRRAVFTLGEGDVTLSFPSDLSPDGYEELSEYLQIFLRRAKRLKQASSED